MKAIFCAVAAFCCIVSLCSATTSTVKVDVPKDKIVSVAVEAPFTIDDAKSSVKKCAGSAEMDCYKEGTATFAVTSKKSILNLKTINLYPKVSQAGTAVPFAVKYTAPKSTSPNEISITTGSPINQNSLAIPTGGVKSVGVVMETLLVKEATGCDKTKEICYKLESAGGKVTITGPATTHLEKITLTGTPSTPCQITVSYAQQNGADKTLGITAGQPITGTVAGCALQTITGGDAILKKPTISLDASACTDEICVAKNPLILTVKGTYTTEKGLTFANADETSILTVTVNPVDCGALIAKAAGLLAAMPLLQLLNM